MATIQDKHAGMTAMTHIEAGEQSLLKTLEADWRRMCGNEEVSVNARFDPAKLDAALPYAFVLRRVGPGTARFRVAGQELHNMLRMDPRGMPFSSFFDERSRETVMEMVDAAFTLPAIVAVPLISPRTFGRKPLRATALLLPMRDSDGDMTRILGAFAVSGPIGRKVHQFEIDKDVQMRVDPLEGRYPDRRAGPRSWKTNAPAVSRKPLPVMADVPRDTQERPHLRLVVDNSVA